MKTPTRPHTREDTDAAHLVRRCNYHGQIDKQHELLIQSLSSYASFSHYSLHLKPLHDGIPSGAGIHLLPTPFRPNSHITFDLESGGNRHLPNTTPPGGLKYNDPTEGDPDECK